MAFEAISETRCFGGLQTTCSQHSESTGTSMRFSIFRPPVDGQVPVLYFLSGLTCSEDNFATKAGAQRRAAELGIALVVPDTSPRGLDLPGEHEDWDFGSGAGFWLDATVEPWSKNYRMESWLISELLPAVEREFELDGSCRGVFGHSMGGHGALTLAMRYPQLFGSVSALAPIVAPCRVPWGEKAFSGYLGSDRESWAEHDACELVASRGWTGPILIDQGEDDPFLVEQLRPELFKSACAEAGVSLDLRLHPGYDHGYHFIATFVADHLDFHARELGLD